MCYRNPLVEHHRAQALKTAQTTLQRYLSTPALVSTLSLEELELLQESEVELRHHLSRRRKLRLPRFHRLRALPGIT